MRIHRILVRIAAVAAVVVTVVGLGVGTAAAPAAAAPTPRATPQPAAVRANPVRWSAPDTFDPSRGPVDDLSCAGQFCALLEDYGAVFTRPTPASAWMKTYQATSGSDFVALFCASASFCVLSSNSGLESHFNGVTWSKAKRIGVGVLTSLSCIDDTSCHAVDQAGGFYSWNGSAWTRKSGPFTESAQLTCASAIRCLEIDRWGRTWRLDGTTWAAGHRITTHYVNQVSCSSPSFCVVTDVAARTYRYDGASWTRIGSAPRAMSDDRLSCGADGHCLTTVYPDAVATLTGTNWSKPVHAYTDPNGAIVACAAAHSCTLATRSGSVKNVIDGHPGRAAIVVPRQGQPFAVSCSTRVDCAAIDRWGNAFVRNRSGWSYTPRHLARQVDAVSCATPTWCFVSAGANGFVYNGSTWASIGHVDGYGLNDVSCSARARCVGVDHAGRAATLTGKRWTFVAVSGTRAHRGDLGWVSCSSPGHCLAIGSGHAAYRLVGGRWVSQRAALDKLRPGSVRTVSCPTDRQCFVSTARGAVAHLTGTRWTRTLGVGSSISSLSCGTASYCIATGSRTEQFDGRSWSESAALPHVPPNSPSSPQPPGFYGSAPAPQVSCAAAGACTMVLGGSAVVTR